jgi:hypothetical protein
MTTAWPRRRLQRFCLNNVRSASAEREGIGKMKMPQARLQIESRTRGEAVQWLPLRLALCSEFPTIFEVLPAPTAANRTFSRGLPVLCSARPRPPAKRRHHIAPICTATPAHLVNIEKYPGRHSTFVSGAKALATRCCSPSYRKLHCNRSPCFSINPPTPSTPFRT